MLFTPLPLSAGDIQDLVAVPPYGILEPSRQYSDGTPREDGVESSPLSLFHGLVISLPHTMHGTAREGGVLISGGSKHVACRMLLPVRRGGPGDASHDSSFRPLCWAARSTDNQVIDAAGLLFAHTCCFLTPHSSPLPYRTVLESSGHNLDLLLMPGLGFDRTGRRLGRGGG